MSIALTQARVLRATYPAEALAELYIAGEQELPSTFLFSHSTPREFSLYHPHFALVQLFLFKDFTHFSEIKKAFCLYLSIDGEQATLRKFLSSWGYITDNSRIKNRH